MAPSHLKAAALAALAALMAGTALFALAGCAGTGSGSHNMTGIAAPAPAAVRAAGQPAPSFAGLHAGPESATGQGSQATLPLPPGPAIIYTASLTVRASDVQNAAARAAALATAAGGYVASESTTLDHAHPARATVSIQLKIPVAAYPATLAALTNRLGTRISLSQQAQDVTLTVADVASRVASAQAAIAQLRTLLARAGTVSSLLEVQDQINAEEASLEELQSQQRALTHQTSYATISVLLVSRPAPAPIHPVKLASGFTAGLAAGWRALRQVTSWALTGIGAALPFGILVALAGLAAYRGGRWLARRRQSPRPAE